MREDGEYGGGPKRGKKEFNPWQGRGEKEWDKREKEKPGRGCPFSTQGRGGCRQPCRELPWKDGRDRYGDTSLGDRQGRGDQERPSQYKAKAAEGQGWECVRV